MRLLLVGAFPYPHHQGSQVYFQEQAIALRAAGVDVELLTYGLRDPAPGSDPDRWRALDGFVHHAIPRSARPRSTKSGPSLARPRADLALRRAIHDAIASKIATGASFDAVMTHNIEACVMSLLARVTHPKIFPPIVYCVHTLMRHELSAYPSCLKTKGFRAGRVTRAGMQQRVKRVIDSVGERVDRFVARRVDGWIALTQTAARVMRRDSARPGAIVAPPLPDPRHRFFDEAPSRPLPSDPFFLYTGNLDGYQELPLLDGAARALADGGEQSARVVVASFDRAVLDPARRWAPGIEPRHVETEGEMQALIGAARATIVPRQAEGGFPIKLANSLAQGTPAIAFHDREWGLEDRRDVWRADARRPEESLAEAIATLAHDAEQAEKMGLNALDRYRAAHRPAAAARETIALVEAVLAARGGR